MFKISITYHNIDSSKTYNLGFTNESNILKVKLNNREIDKSALNNFVFDNDGYFLSWDNEQMEDNVIRILLDFFVYNGKNYDRFSEEFYEKAYEIDELKSMLKNFEIIGIYDELTENPPKANSERVFFVCKKVK